MLGKCLKYDLKAVWKYWWFALVAMTMLVPIGVVAVNFIVSNGSGTAWLEALAFMVFMLGVCAFIIVTKVLVYLRYYKNFFTDEGYLTFTLPVKRSTLYKSKLINGVIWDTAMTVTLLTMLAIILIFIHDCDCGGASANEAHANLLVCFLSYVASLFKARPLAFIAYAIVALLIGFAGEVLSVALYQAIITIGCTIVKKAKLIVTIAMFYALSGAESVFMYVCIFAMMPFISAVAVLDPAGPSHPILFVWIILFAIFVVIATACVAVISFNMRMLERRLNLA